MARGGIEWEEMTDVLCAVGGLGFGISGLVPGAASLELAAPEKAILAIVPGVPAVRGAVVGPWLGGWPSRNMPAALFFFSHDAVVLVVPGPNIKIDSDG